jgi:hypothetical protein
LWRSLRISYVVIESLKAFFERLLTGGRFAAYNQKEIMLAQTMVRPQTISAVPRGVISTSLKA